MSKQIEIENPRAGERPITSEKRAMHFVHQGVAVIHNGRLKYLDRATGMRMRSDVYVDQRGPIYWNGARSIIINGEDVAKYPPCCNVVYPWPWSKNLNAYTVNLRGNADAIAFPFELIVKNTGVGVPAKYALPIKHKTVHASDPQASGKRYCCSICDKRFHELFSINEHMRINHPRRSPNVKSVA